MAPTPPLPDAFWRTASPGLQAAGLLLVHHAGRWRDRRRDGEPVRGADAVGCDDLPMVRSTARGWESIGTPGPDDPIGPDAPTGPRRIARGAPRPGPRSVGGRSVVVGEVPPSEVLGLVRGV